MSQRLTHPLSLRNLLLLSTLLIIFSTAGGNTIITSAITDTLIVPHAIQQGIRGRVLPATKPGAFKAAKNTSRTLSAPATPPCNNTTFFMRIPAPAGEKIELKKIQTLVNTNFLLSGNIIFPDNHHEGLLIRMDNSGSIIDQQTFRVDNQPTTIWDAKALSNGTVFIGGSIDNGTNTIFAALLNTDLSIKNIRKIPLAETPQKLTADIIDVDPPLSYSIAVQLTNSALGILLKDDLSVKWTSRIDLPGLVELVAFSDYTWSPLALVANCIVAGKKNIVLNELGYNTVLIN